METGFPCRLMWRPQSLWAPYFLPSLYSIMPFLESRSDSRMLMLNRNGTPPQLSLSEATPSPVTLTSPLDDRASFRSEKKRREGPAELEMRSRTAALAASVV